MFLCLWEDISAALITIKWDFSSSFLKNVSLWAGPTDRWRKTWWRNEWLSAGGGQALPDVLRRSSHCDPQKKKKNEQWCARELLCVRTLWCGTHTCARSNTIAVLGKKLRLKKNKKRGKKGEILLFFGGSERWRTGEGRGTAHVPERRPFTGAGGERRKDWLSGLWAVSPAAGWLLAIQS